ncbi:sigma-70 family RNA polymerase sigma factor [Sorangium sp. So ce375]|uniref:RNA polymerase sigma factor n=1 Tax=Sorangium sp. So ce375 TaxID=3133306 RepID=UPI003F5B8DCB
MLPARPIALLDEHLRVTYSPSTISERWEAIAPSIPALIRRCIPVARSVLRWSEEAQDIAHDCLCRIVMSNSYWKLGDDIGRLIIVATKHQSISLARRRSRGCDLVTETGELPEPSSVEPFDGRVLLPSLASVLTAVHLTPCEMQAVLLVYQGYDFKQIGTMLKIEPESAKKRFYRAFKKLRDWAEAAEQGLV